jgi:hypothetical protein
MNRWEPRPASNSRGHLPTCPGVLPQAARGGGTLGSERKRARRTRPVTLWVAGRFAFCDGYRIAGMGLFEDLANEAPILKQVWRTFLLAVVAVGTAAWSALHFLYKKRFSDMNERLLLRQEEADRLTRLIEDLKPEKTAYGRLTNDALKERTNKLIKRLRGFYEEELRNEIKHQEQERLFRSAEWPPASLEAGRQLFKERWTSTFEADFKTEAILLRNEILQRLSHIPTSEVIRGGIWGPGGEYHVDLSMYNSIMYIVQVEVLANHLQALSELLPPSPSIGLLQ